MNRGAETGDQEPLLGPVEDVLEPGPDGSLGFGVTWAVGVSGVGQKQKDTTLAVVGEGMEVKEFVVGGGGIDLEIAGVDDHA